METEYKAMWGTVSHAGGLWCLHYEKHGSSSSITKEGYGPEVFKDFRGPVVRFDKATLGAVMKSLRGPTPVVKGWNNPLFGEKELTLEEYLQIKRDLGIPVEIWAD